ncbi:hypothetical protein [Bifidobacterium oedipodis]|uniref:Uncharacterized protein n=1 Tax=Bifidobacterium oedipodis TaxID=2675322 RepID=A0A7Y0HSW4_9BIFI|nr:hypothetical protein [Bifidobacterium sp. DSM 109957]NMM94023.1 hypothetical protein [Bifidobacterium sp. DSM 109957]
MPYLEAEECAKNDDEILLSITDVFGEGYRPIDDGFEPDFE